MAKFSADFTNQLRNFGRRDPNAPAEPLLGTNDPLAKSLGGLFGMDMRTGRERAQADRAKLDPKLAPLDKLMAEYQIQSQYAETDSARNAAMAGLAQTQAAIAARDKKAADAKKLAAGTEAAIASLKSLGYNEEASLLRKNGLTLAQGQNLIVEGTRMNRVNSQGTAARSALLANMGLGDTGLALETKQGKYDNMPAETYSKMVKSVDNNSKLANALASGDKDVESLRGEIESGLIRTPEQLDARRKELRMARASKDSAAAKKATPTTAARLVRLPNGEVKPGGDMIVDGKTKRVVSVDGEWVDEPEGSLVADTKYPTKQQLEDSETMLIANFEDLYADLGTADKLVAQSVWAKSYAEQLKNGAEPQKALQETLDIMTPMFQADTTSNWSAINPIREFFGFKAIDKGQEAALLDPAAARRKRYEDMIKGRQKQ